jgi:peptidoglycan/LPS O-acetylase OafA/YrhL
MNSTVGYLRLLLALAVVCEHFGLPYKIVGGQIAVQLFFLISGFLISYVIVEKERYLSVAQFYLSRAARIFPPYWCVALAVLVARLFDPRFCAAFARLTAPAQALVASANAVVFGQDWVMFLTETNGALAFTPDFHASVPQLWTLLLVPPGWSLGLELSFYLIAPLMIRRRAVLWAVLALSLTGRALAAGLPFDPWAFRFFPFEMALFAAGALSHQILLPLARQYLAPGAVTFAVLVALAAYPLYEVPPIAVALVAVSLPALMLSGGAFDRWSGELSFPLYLIHWPVMLAATRLGVPPLLGAVLAIAAAIGLLYAVVLPNERLRSRIARHGPENRLHPNILPDARAIANA